MDLVLPVPAKPQPDEYTRMREILMPFLHCKQPVDLTDDVTFLVISKGTDRSVVATWARAAHLASRTEVPVQAFYTWAGAGLSPTLGEIPVPSDLTVDQQDYLFN